ncbi:tryptophan-rich sensory protein [Candidatus Dependentiae bacterium]|nr:tryptophan-rich sensory protein [Candidatus Dependentiae bacterium]
MVRKLWYILIPAVVFVISTLNWYASSIGMQAFAVLQQPPLLPPPVVFVVAWNLIYLCIIAALILLINHTNPGALRTKILMLAGFNLFLNLIWGALWAFGIHGFPMIAETIAVSLSTLSIILVAWHNLPLVAWLYVPYFLWSLVTIYLAIATATINHLLF